MSGSATLIHSLEKYFEAFRNHVVGHDAVFPTPYGNKRMVYADWTASGRLYEPIELKILNDFGPLVGNTHTETSTTGTAMTLSYHEAQKIIKKHVNAGPGDKIIMCGSGMTGAINKFQRILGLRIPDRLSKFCRVPETEKPVIFVTHMEHHSNHTSWLETIGEVVCVEPDRNGLVDLESFDVLLEEYKDRPYKIAAITSCSNVTGIMTPYHAIAKRIHQAGGICFVDFACSAPYVPVNMHPEDPEERLDAIYFSPHKFLGGPGTPGALIFNADLYTNQVPDHPGGGTVNWTNPWGEMSYVDDIEAREDGGTPPFLQTIKAALAVRLKEKMGIDNILKREKEQLKLIFGRLRNIPNLHLLAGHIDERLGVISFYIDELHYNLGVKLLNDRFGIQVRGGCSCAGTYGHYLLNVSKEFSHSITEKIDMGDLSDKPGWIRMSVHPVMTDTEITFILNAIEALALNFREWGTEYMYDNHCNEFLYKKAFRYEHELVKGWFEES